MEILRVFNNNVVLARTAEGGEVVLSGRGLGFQARPGQRVDPDLVVRTFVPVEGSDPDTLALHVSAIPPEHLRWAADALEIARRRLHTPLPVTSMIAVADHVSYAIKRARQGIDFDFPLAAEVANLYPEELSVATEVLAAVNARLEVPLPDTEAFAIALHLVNAGFSTGDLSRTYAMTGVFTQILDVLEQALGTRFDRHSLNVARFITHLRYFFVRQSRGQQFGDQLAGSFAEAIRREHPDAYQAAVKLQAVLELRLGEPVSDDEVSYLTLHVARLATESGAHTSH